MSMPTFSAEASLYKTSGHYHTDRHAINSSTQMTQMITAISPAAKGQDFPDQKCTCKGCASGGGDVTGQCSNVCKDKTVYSKGSEPYDYCKATDTGLTRPPTPLWWDYVVHDWGGVVSL